MQIDGMEVIRIAATDAAGNPILNDGEGCITRSGVFYVVDDQIERETL